MSEFKSEHYFLEPRRSGSKVEKLFHAYLDSSQQGGSDFRDISNGSEKAFMMLRKDLASRLYRYVLAMDPRKFSSSKQFFKYDTVLKNSVTARLLLSLGLYKSGVHLAKQTIKAAMEAETWDVIYTLSSILSTFYSLRYNSSKFHEYDSLADFAIQRMSGERELRKMINKWTLLFAKKRKATPDDIEKLIEDMKVGDEIVHDVSTPNLLHFNFRLKLLYYDAIMDYEKAIDICEEARKRLQESAKSMDVAKLGIYHGTQMYCYLNLKRFEEASFFADRIDEYFPIGTLNWFIITEYYFVLCIQTSRFDNAYEQLYKALGTRSYDQLSGVRRQMWNLFEGYMQFVIKSGLWKKQSKQLDVRQFRVAKFLNEVISLSGDKAGINVSVLILQIMFLLQQGRYEDIIDRKDALRRYVYRYLYSKENERSRIFLNMLLRMIECDFSYSITKTKTQRLYKALTEQQMNYQANLGGNEIVDYEVLWNWALNTIKGSLTWKANAAS